MKTFTATCLATILCAVAVRAAVTASGYNGTQTFVTAPGKDPAEPSACGVIGGASYWFTYQPPTNGTATFDTKGTAFNTVLGVYVDNGSGCGYSCLLPVTCNDNASNGVTWSLVQWTASPKTNYFIMFDGVNGAYGTAYLNYLLNTPPTITTIANQTKAEDTSTGNLAFTVGDKETAVGSLTVTATSSNTALVGNTNIVLGGTTANRTINITPIKDASGTSLITLTVRDAGSLTASKSFLLTVTAVNDAPVATAQSVTNAEDTAKSITLAGTDAEGSPLTYTIATLPKNGTLTGAAPNLTYTPKANYVGADSIIFNVKDGSLSSANATISITVTAVNDAPVATPQSVTTTEDTAKAITLAGTDAEASALTYSVVTPPANGTLTGTAPSLTYKPNTNYFGPDSFTFKATDSSLLSSSNATVSLTVTAVNDAPRTVSDTVTRLPGQSITIARTFPKRNDSDVDSTNLTVTAVASKSKNAVAITLNTTNIIYSASTSTNADWFTYTVSDGTATAIGTNFVNVGANGVLVVY